LAGFFFAPNRQWRIGGLAEVADWRFGGSGGNGGNGGNGGKILLPFFQ
jgi:hypothetical protein